MTPRGKVPDIIRDCGKIGTSVATAFTANVVEVGNESRALWEKTVEIGRAGGVQLVGPNRIGIIGIKPSFALTTNNIMELSELPCGGISVISQSGSLLITYIILRH